MKGWKMKGWSKPIYKIFSEDENEIIYEETRETVKSGYSDGSMVSLGGNDNRILPPGQQISTTFHKIDKRYYDHRFGEGGKLVILRKGKGNE